MKNYMYKVIASSKARGYNCTVVVYEIKRNKPIYLGFNEQIDTASTYGGFGEAVQLIAKLKGHKHDNYKFMSKSINLYAI